jgi:hypothetical protein
MIYEIRDFQTSFEFYTILNLPTTQSSSWSENKMFEI